MENMINPFFWVVVVATALSGFFSLAGYSLRAFRRVGFGDESNKKRHRRLELLERNLTPLKLTASFCRAVCNLVLVIGMLYMVNPPPGDMDMGRTIMAIVAASGVIAIFGVAIPHTWSAIAGERILNATLEVLLFFRYLLYPIIMIMQSLDLPVRRLAGMRENQSEADTIKQEILQAATDGAAEGTVASQEVEMIASVIEFGDRQAGSIMTPRTDIFALALETHWVQACKEIVTAGHSRVPVFSGDLDNIVGILYAKDLLGYIESAEPVELRSIMRKPYFVPESKSLKDLLQEFKTRRIHFSVVLDEFGGTAGVVTIEDILEEIVGEIDDEYDRAEPALMHRIDEKLAEVDGRMYIEDLNLAMGLTIPQDRDYMTVAGMVFSELGYIPKAGENVDAYGARFTVVGADERKITRLRVEKLPDEANDQD